MSEKSLEMLWIEKRVAASPAQNSAPSRVRSAMPSCAGGARQRGDVAGDRTAAELGLEGSDDLVEYLLKIHG